MSGTALIVCVPRWAYPVLKRTILRDRIVFATAYPRTMRVGLRRKP